LKLLLDTHVLVWQFVDDPRFTGKIRELVLDRENDVIVSDVSIWEVAIKIQCQKLTVKISELEAEIAYHEYQRMPVLRKHMVGVAALPRHHRDPFDHLLIAQALVEDIPILTTDDKFSLYQVKLAI
jgi:PIN domain nuclease of toxin-antitoxin system